MDETLIDARGLLCPLPVLKLRKALLGMPHGATVLLWADDPVAVVDVPHFCAEQGHDFLGQDTRDGSPLYRVRRGM